MFIKIPKAGFTLAEVLVTLVVIGVVAALCIPALLENTNQAELRASFKKSLSMLNQSLYMNYAQNATDTYTCCNTSGDNTATGLTNFFANKLNTIAGPNGNVWFNTNDGMQYTVTKFAAANGCTASEPSDPSFANCVMLVDVNGAKPPNIMSTGLGSLGTLTYKDQYQVVIRENAVIPASNATSDVSVQALEN